MNELLFFGTALFCLIATLVAFWLWGKKGLYVWVVLATIVMNIEVVKCIDMFGLAVTLGNVLYGSVFLCTDIMSELYGGKESRKLVAVGFFALFVATIVMQLGLLYIPNSQDWASGMMKDLFGFMPRICLASTVAYIVSNTLDTYTYEWIAKRTTKKWIRNNGSTLSSQLLDSFLFSIIAFAGVFDWLTIVELSLTTYAIKAIFAMLDTPFLYLACKISKHIKDAER